MTIKIVAVLIILFTVSQSQVSPIWSSTPRIDTGDIILVNSGLASTNWTTLWTTTYSSGAVFSASPWVGLSIKQIRIASNTQQIGVFSYLDSVPTITSFVNRVDIVSPTSVWYLKVRYIAYDNSLNTNSQIQLKYRVYDPEITNIKTGTGVRTDFLPTTFTSVTTTNNVIVVAFTSGFQGTLHNSFFQGNISQIIETNGSITLSVKVPSDTRITKISFYTFVVDLTKLFVKSWIFAQAAVTKSTFGNQYTFFIPRYANFNQNYISGLRSFSLIENIQYNFTVNGLNFTTYSDSYYNDAGHMNFWVRTCPSPYTLFNQVDFLCYNLCPAGTYLVSADSLCVACHYSCATCTTGTSCVTCPTNKVLDPNTTFCVCIDYYYELNQVCVACHYSCQKCVYSGQYYNCIKCDANMHRGPPTPNNSTCDCLTGYRDVGVTACGDICGDGSVRTDPCDDGNTIDNDGCSSSCQKEQYFSCDNPIPPAVTPASNCYFTGDITVNVVRIQKDPLVNIATFYLNITPNVKIWSQLSVYNLVTNISNYSFIKSTISGNLFAYTISYPKSFQGQTIMFGIKPSGSGPLSRFYPKNQTFVAHANNGLLLVSYENTDYMESLQLGTSAYIIGFIFTGFGIILCFGDWKQLGLELFFSVQICFMTFAVLQNHDPYITQLMYVRNVMGWSGQIPMQIPPYHTYGVLEQMQYSVPFINNFNIMVIFPGVALLLYFGYRGALYRHQKLRLEGQTSKDFEQTDTGKVLQYFKFDLFVYFMLINMQQILFSTVVQAQYVQNGAIFAYIVLLLIGVLICIVSLFIRPNSMEAYRKRLFHTTYGNRTFLFVLVSVLIMDILLLLSVVVNKNIFYAMFLLPVIMSVYLIGRRPFKFMQNNVRLFIIQCCLITVVALQVVLMNTTYSLHKTYPIGILVCMGIIFLVTLIAWIIDVVRRICKLRTGQDYQKQSKQSHKEEQSINEKVREAGFALVNNNLNGSRMPTTYQMSNMPVSSRKRSNIQPIKSPQNKSHLKRLGQEKTSKVKSKPEPESSFKTNEKRSKSRQKSNVKGNEDILRLRQDTVQKIQEAPSARRKINAYQQILQQTSNRYK